MRTSLHIRRPIPIHSRHFETLQPKPFMTRQPKTFRHHRTHRQKHHEQHQTHRHQHKPPNHNAYLPPTPTTTKRPLTTPPRLTLHALPTLPGKAPPTHPRLRLGFRFRLWFRLHRRRDHLNITRTGERRARRRAKHPRLRRNRRFTRIRIHTHRRRHRHRKPTTNPHIIHIRTRIRIRRHQLISRPDEHIIPARARIHKTRFTRARHIRNREHTPTITFTETRRPRRTRPHTRQLPLIHIQKTITIMRHQRIRALKKQPPTTFRQITRKIKRFSIQ